jgi:hypothetical protein
LRAKIVEKLIQMMNLVRFRFKGQVSETSDLGRLIYALCSLSTTRVVVEIGTWNGLGSTKIMCRAAAQRPQNSVEIISVEANENLHGAAKKNLKKFEKLGFLKLLYGSIVKDSQLLQSNLSPTEKLWLESDLRDIAAAPNLTSAIPSEIDLLLLDGGEFSTYAEYQALKPLVGSFILLDDTNTRKCQRIIEEIANDDFQLIWKSTERNGTALLSRRQARQNEK